MKIDVSHHTRASFASVKFNQLIDDYRNGGHNFINGINGRTLLFKLNQCKRIWDYYTTKFANLKAVNHPTIITKRIDK